MAAALARALAGAISRVISGASKSGYTWYKSGYKGLKWTSNLGPLRPLIPGLIPLITGLAPLITRLITPTKALASAAAIQVDTPLRPM
jgi:hypothetical protein